ncbi:MAG: hypothetical protein M1827_002474 [Pycnora praestabilis]|nr:MAG: hypothetical protein M1827_002474 [Pycnora praestabilis]
MASQVEPGLHPSDLSQNSPLHRFTRALEYRPSPLGKDDPWEDIQSPSTPPPDTPLLWKADTSLSLAENSARGLAWDSSVLSPTFEDLVSRATSPVRAIDTHRRIVRPAPGYPLKPIPQSTPVQGAATFRAANGHRHSANCRVALRRRLGGNLRSITSPGSASPRQATNGLEKTIRGYGKDLSAEQIVRALKEHHIFWAFYERRMFQLKASYKQSQKLLEKLTGSRNVLAEIQGLRKQYEQAQGELAECQYQLQTAQVQLGQGGVITAGSHSHLFLDRSGRPIAHNENSLIAPEEHQKLLQENLSQKQMYLDPACERHDQRIQLGENAKHIAHMEEELRQEKKRNEELSRTVEQWTERLTRIGALGESLHSRARRSNT